MQARLYSYIGGVIKNHKGKLIEIGGMPDHVHILVELSLPDKFSQFVRNIKSCSSFWVHQNFPQKKDFSWQEGYGSFSVSFSTLERVRDYIQNQKKHHENVSFDQEYLKFLNHHRMSYDKRFVLG